MGEAIPTAVPTCIKRLYRGYIGHRKQMYRGYLYMYMYIYICVCVCYTGVI